MLRTRILTALVILALLIPAIFLLDGLSWSILTAVITGLGAWEFGRLAGFCKSGQVQFGLLIGVLATGFAVGLPAASQAALGEALLVLSAAFWILVVPFWLRARWQIKTHALMALVGLVVLLPTWFALTSLRERGAAWLLGAIVLVAVADIAAYFFGRAFGRRKLAPNISPGKTWEGAWGAMATVTALALALQGLYGSGLTPKHLLILLVAVPMWTLVSIAGDLFESMLKRQAGLKDSSQLLPGHGGILDRIDSHTAALPMLALLLSAA